MQIPPAVNPPEPENVMINFIKKANNSCKAIALLNMDKVILNEEQSDFLSL